MTPADLIGAYLKLRTKIIEVETRHKEEMLPYINLKTEIETSLLAHLNDLGLDSTKCKAGTAYRATATSVKVKDWDKTLAFIRENELWELLEARANKTVALELLDERKKPIPGVEITTASVLRVRSS